MILKKPYYIFVKHFRLFHFLLALCSAYLFYRTNLINSFFNDYLGSNTSVIGTNLLENLFTTFIYFVLLITVLGLTIIFILMKKNEKQYKLYLIGIGIYIFALVTFIISHGTLSSLEIGQVSVQRLKMVNDLLTISMILQFITMIILIVRATGFNIKKFDFENDLKLDEKDAEEFELNVELDSGKVKRDYKRTLRYIKYAYKENKIFVFILAFIVILITSVSIYLYFNVYNKKYKFELITTTNYNIQLSDAYYTRISYKNSVIADDQESLVIVKLNLLSFRENKFEIGRLTLKIGEHSFKATTDYNNELIDIGTLYKSQTISKELKPYLFVFKVPTGFLDEKIELNYLDFNNKNIIIEISPKSYSESDEGEYIVGDTIDFKNSVLENTSLKIDSYELSNFFKVEYNFNVGTEAFASHEYVMPSFTGKTNRILLKLTGEFETGNESITDLADFINKFGAINIIIGEQKHSVTNVQQVSPLKIKQENIHYLEVPDYALNAESLTLLFNIRGKTYTYKLK